MLRKLRIILAAIFFIGITLLFLGIGREWWGWMAKLQFLPSCLALNAAVIAGILLLTILFGRVYCSVICPLGVFQDQIFRLRQRLDKKHKQSWSKPKKALRGIVLIIFIVCIIADVQVVVALLAPYSAYGRIITSIVHTQTWTVALVAGITLVTVTVLAWMGGRIWCNTICPVGSVLGVFARFSLFRPVLDSEKCLKCGKCSKGCRASCIDLESKTIDYSRCVSCLDCTDNCKFGALSYRFAYGRKTAAEPEKNEQKPHSEQTSRRAFIAGALIAGSALTVKAQEQKLDGGLAVLEKKQKPQRTEPVLPFGAQSQKNFYNHCTACQLCVQNCPSDVLKPTTDLTHFMQPQMTFEDGYCRIDCTRCSEVCPAGAILPITPEEKSTIHAGYARVSYDLCVVNRDGVSCGNCARHCPTGAIIMISKDPGDKDSLKVPTVDESKCIGCGACEHLCPSRPFSAIFVNGYKEHRHE